MEEVLEIKEELNTKKNTEESHVMENQRLPSLVKRRNVQVKMFYHSYTFDQFSYNRFRFLLLISSENTFLIKNS